MTIYTDQVTGKKYDRVHGGLTTGLGPVVGYKPCSECAFASHDEACARAVPDCTINDTAKTVFFVFKERKA